ncbi:MAG: DNA polymerase III subunit chi [Rickettsiales bacterium]
MNNKPEVSFYQITVSPLERVLPKILEKVYEDLEHRCFILCEDETQLAELNDSLWAIGGRNFLPHDTTKCKDPDKQPILLGTEINNINNSDVLIVLKDYFEESNEFKKVFDIFHGLKGNDLEMARERYKKYRDMGCQLKFWKQDAEGKWTQG